MPHVTTDPGQHAQPDRPAVDRRVFRDLVALLLVVVGAVLIAAGTATWNWHAGVIVAGVEVGVLGVVLGMDGAT